MALTPRSGLTACTWGFILPPACAGSAHISPTSWLGSESRQYWLPEGIGSLRAWHILRWRGVQVSLIHLSPTPVPGGFFGAWRDAQGGWRFRAGSEFSPARDGVIRDGRGGRAPRASGRRAPH